MGLSIVLYATAANVAWASQSPRGARFSRLMAWLRTRSASRVAAELARWLYYLALPWATLMLGYSTARALGVWHLDWLENLVLTIGVALGAAIVFIWVWQPYARIEHPQSFDASGWNWARHMVELIYQQAHWAFYRSGPVLWLNDFYWGSFFGLALILIEGWTNPATRAKFLEVGRADTPLWTGSLAVVSTIIFVLTQNTWYCLIVHILLDLGLRPVIGFSRVRAAGE